VEVRSARTSAPQVTEVRASGTYGGSVTPVAHFGLGPGIESVAEVVVQWPDGRRTTLTDVAANRVVQVAPES